MDDNLFKLRDRGVPKAQHTILSLKEELIIVSHQRKDGLAEVVGVLLGVDLREGNLHVHVSNESRRCNSPRYIIMEPVTVCVFQVIAIICVYV